MTDRARPDDPAWRRRERERLARRRDEIRATLNGPRPGWWFKHWFVANETYRRGYSLMVFAEGTRSRTGDLASFHKGAVRLAIDNGAALLPVVSSGTFDIKPPGSVFVYPGQVVVKILDTVEMAEYTFRDITPLTNELHDRMLGAYEELRNEPS